MEESPKERLYASPLIQSNERRKAAFWDYASAVVMGVGGEISVANLCDDRGLACYESEELPAPADLTLLRHKDRHRRDHDPSEADKRDPGALDIVYGRFRFDEDLLKRAVPAPSFTFVVVADAWAVVQRTYDGRLTPDAFLERRFPRGVQAFVLSLAGRPQNGTISKNDCDRAVRHLDAFALVADDTEAVTTVLYGLYDVEAPAAPPPAPLTFLQVSAAAKARVLDASRCHARVVAAARALPTFFLLPDLFCCCFRRPQTRATGALICLRCLYKLLQARRREGGVHMGACREMRLPRSESESQSMSPSAALDSLAAAAAPAPATPAAGQSSSTSTEDRCFAGFALSGVKSYAGGPSSSSSSFSSARDTAAAGRSSSESESGGGGRLPASSLYDDDRGFAFFVPPVARPDAAAKRHAQHPALQQ